MKILIVDDEKEARVALEGILSLADGYTIEAAYDGQEAVEKVRNNLYDLLLLDIVMPKMDGYEVLRQVRTLFPDLPVIFVTGKGISSKVTKAVAENKLNGVIEKPFTPQTVVDAVKTILARKPRRV